MKQLLQQPGSGDVFVADVPAPALPSGAVLVRTAASAVSAGTERMMLDFAGKSLAAKALARPDLVAQVVAKIQREGLLTTIDTVRNRLDAPAPLGYSAAGTIVDVASDVEGFAIGHAVACAGAGFANHAEIIAVPVRLCAAVPQGLPMEEAAFATIGAIALHGVRLATLQIGGTVAVIGLGLLGQLAAQFARAAGCRVVGVDLREDRNGLARELGAVAAVMPSAAEDVVRELAPAGVDAVLITADARSSEPVDLAGVLARDRGTVVAIGSVGMEIPRRTYYGKELTFLVSRSYGPGRYDPAYELQGHDYPIGYVRWTEQRNLAAVLDLIAAGSVRIAPLISHRFAIDEARQAYALVTGERKDPFLGVVLTYPGEAVLDRVVKGAMPPAKTAERTPAIGVLGTGTFATGTLLPALKDAGAQIVAVASAQGMSAAHSARRFNAAYATTDEARIVSDPDLAAIVIATRHNLHARQVLAAHAAGKHVFVEKPLCLTAGELDAIAEAFRRPGAPLLMVGFNRRFAPLAVRLKAFAAEIREPKVVQYRINAGYVARDHWTQDPAVGGGRILGEACHFVDFASFLIGEPIVSVEAAALPDGERYRGDNAVITLRFRDGSLAVVSYLACGSPSLGKERIEVAGAGRSAVLDDFRSLTLYRGRRRSVDRSWLRQDKGHRGECRAFVDAVSGRAGAPVALEELLSSTRATLAAAESLRTGSRIDLLAR